ncbi:hypothetical protein [Acidianus sp. RZ1]|uniref:NADH-quinone oxidoreductase subunit D-related protein n=1 Tax=Acidianus sp. RZ1 TaxID=1540082 RepID=UPI001490DCEF|nr:hypothetical protein [Acidianus sp. RZ1]NON62668.1 hypothetical protein [Acidianus sp. RZ1]
MRMIGQLGEFCLYSDRIEKGICPERETLKKENYRSIQGFTFAYGPSAGGLLESVGIDLDTFGEYISDVKVIPYKIRKVRVKSIIDNSILYIERINGSFSASHTISFITAIEEGLGIEPPYEVKIGRIVEMELERIRNHLIVMQRVVEAAGFSVPSFQLLYLIEKVNRVIAKSFGHRYFYGVNGLGSLRFYEEIKSLEEIKKEYKEIYRGIIDNRIFIDRLQSNGVIVDKEGIGPVARSASFKNDARNDGNYAEIYKELGFSTVTYDEGDAFGRFIVRGEEVEESLRILSSINLHSVEYESKKRNNEGEGIGRVESPSGDLAYYVKVNENIIKEVYLFAPSSYNILAFSSSMVKNIFTDFPFNWESFGIWLSEVGVIFE